MKKNKPTFTLQELLKGWIEFKPVVPLSWSVAARRAARNK